MIKFLESGNLIGRIEYDDKKGIFKGKLFQTIEIDSFVCDYIENLNETFNCVVNNTGGK